MKICRRPVRASRARRVDGWRRATSHRITFSHNIIFGNLYNANHERNPLIKGGAHVAVVNNLIHDFGAKAIHSNLIAHEWAPQAPQTGIVTLVGNVVRGGDDSLPACRSSAVAARAM